MADAFQSNVFQTTTLAFQIDGTPPPPTPVIAQTPSGVKRGKKRELIVNLRDVENRESTAEYLKSQLRIRNPFEDRIAAEEARARIETKAEQKRIGKREKAMRDSAAKANAVFQAEKLAAEQAAAEQLKVETHNKNMRLLMILAATI